MKVIALVTDGFGASGGIAQYNRNFLVALSTYPHMDTIAVIPRNGISSQIPERIEQLASIGNKLGYSAKSFRETLRRRPDILFCGHLNILPLAWIISKLCRVPIWLQLHGIEAWATPRRRTARLVEDVHLTTCVSRFTRRRFLSWANVDPNRVKIIPNTVSEPSAQGRLCVVAGQGSDQPKTLLTVGRLSASERYKGHDRVIACLPTLLEREPNLTYLIAGDGDDRQRLELLALEHGVAPRVKFLGKVSPAALNALYPTVDLFVMPSTGEGFGIVFLEAMAAGTPALGLDGDGSVDPLQDGCLGVIATEKTLAATILTTLRRQRSKDLPARVQSAFGKHHFEGHIHHLVNHQLISLRR